MWEVFRKTGQQEAFIHNISANLQGAKPEIQARVIEMFSKVTPEISERLSVALQS